MRKCAPTGGHSRRLAGTFAEPSCAAPCRRPGGNHGGNGTAVAAYSAASAIGLFGCVVQLA